MGKNYLKKNIKHQWRPYWAKQATEEMNNGNEPYMEYEPDGKHGGFPIDDNGVPQSYKVYDFDYGTVDTFMCNGHEIILKGYLYLNHNVQVWLLRCNKEYVFTVSYFSASNYWAYWSDVHKIKIGINADYSAKYREVDRDDIEKIDEIFQTVIPNCYIGNLMLKKILEEWNKKKEEN